MSYTFGEGWGACASAFAPSIARGGGELHPFGRRISPVNPMGRFRCRRFKGVYPNQTGTGGEVAGGGGPKFSEVRTPLSAEALSALRSNRMPWGGVYPKSSSSPCAVSSRVLRVGSRIPRGGGPIRKLIPNRIRIGGEEEKEQPSE